MKSQSVGLRTQEVPFFHVENLKLNNYFCVEEEEEERRVPLVVEVAITFNVQALQV